MLAVIATVEATPVRALLPLMVMAPVAPALTPMYMPVWPFGLVNTRLVVSISSRPPAETLAVPLLAPLVVKLPPTLRKAPPSVSGLCPARRSSDALPAASLPETFSTPLPPLRPSVTNGKAPSPIPVTTPPFVIRNSPLEPALFTPTLMKPCGPATSRREPAPSTRTSPLLVGPPLPMLAPVNTPGPALPSMRTRPPFWIASVPCALVPVPRRSKA